MFSRIFVAAALFSLASGASLTELESTEAEENSRDPKLFKLISIVSFENQQCTSTSGNTGTCFSQKDCSRNGGQASGTCANGLGICCLFSVTSGGTITRNNTYFNNPGFPNGVTTAGTSSVAITLPTTSTNSFGRKLDLGSKFGSSVSSILAVKLTFNSFTLIGPVDGDCLNDTFTVTGQNSESVVPVLCGNNAGQTVYFYVDRAAGTIQLNFITSSVVFTRTWNVLVQFFSAGNYGLAPRGCLQYFPGTSGSLSSFNFLSSDSTSTMLNTQSYAVCFGYNTGFCNYGFTFSRFDLGNVGAACAADFIALQSRQICGDTTSLVLQANCSQGPIVMFVESDNTNVQQQMGFSGSFLALAL